MSEPEEVTRMSVLTCPTYMGFELMVVIVDKETMESQPYCKKCQEVVGVRLKPMDENFTAFHHGPN